MTRAVALLVVTALVLALPAPAFAYLKFGLRLNDAQVELRWHQMPIRYFVNEGAVPGVSGTEFRDAIGRAFATWQAAPGVDIRAEFAASTTASPGEIDGRTTLGYLDRPDLPRVLGATSFILDATSGAIIESDIFFNARFPWSTAATGETNRVDVESIAVHEIGHLLGLGHSALGETEQNAGGRRVLSTGAVMFPIAFSAGNIAARTLMADDIAGAVDLYATPAATAATGSLSGTITKNGAGLFGAHVVAFNPETGALVGGFSLNPAGEFVIAGLDPGPYILRVEPLDDADRDSFFSGTIDIDFRVTFASRMVVVPPEGSAAPVEIAVRPK